MSVVFTTAGHVERICGQWVGILAASVFANRSVVATLQHQASKYAAATAATLRVVYRASRRGRSPRPRRVDGDYEWREQAPAAFLDRWLAVSPA
jgi:hypothetical protein